MLDNFTRQGESAALSFYSNAGACNIYGLKATFSIFMAKQNECEQLAAINFDKQF
jgi:hypothetical protein